jgi:hypothetical protein
MCPPVLVLIVLLLLQKGHHPAAFVIKKPTAMRYLLLHVGSGPPAAVGPPYKGSAGTLRTKTPLGVSNMSPRVPPPFVHWEDMMVRRRFRGTGDCTGS